MMRRSRRPTLSHLGASAALLLALASAGWAEQPLPFAGPVEAGQMRSPANNEASGLAASRRDADLLWTHDDSGGDPILYGVATNGVLRGKLRINGVHNRDWEDAAAFELDGQPWLLIADTGDNNAKRRSIELHLVPEPAPEKLRADAETVATPAATLRIVYEDGPRDCEAVAVDAQERAVYLLSKRDEVPRLYRVALPNPLASADLTARCVGLVPHLPKPSAIERLFKGYLGQQRARPTGMDFAADGSAAVVLTYGDLLWFPRQNGEPWAEALAREPVVLPSHGMLQAEGVCLSKDGTSIYVVSEMSRTLLRYDRR
jgi:hypothetical protein